MKDAWNPEQYNRFAAERSAPFWDLSGLVDFSGVRTLADVGCGTGELTRDLVSRFGVVDAVGMDSSAKMLEQAARFAGSGLRFEQAPIESWAPSAPFDVVFSNAALQWVEDHPALIPRVWNWVASGGQFAVQMPFNFDHPSHALAEEMASARGLRVRRSPVLAPEEYAGLLDGLGGEDVTVFVKVYLHHLGSSEDVVEWTKGTLLTFYEKQLSPEDYREFLSGYTRELVARLGGRKPYLYTFKRLFLYARKKKE